MPSAGRSKLEFDPVFPLTEAQGHGDEARLNMVDHTFSIPENPGLPPAPAGETPSQPRRFNPRRFFLITLLLTGAGVLLFCGFGALWIVLQFPRYAATCEYRLEPLPGRPDSAGGEAASQHQETLMDPRFQRQSCSRFVSEFSSIPGSKESFKVSVKRNRNDAAVVGVRVSVTSGPLAQDILAEMIVQLERVESVRHQVLIHMLSPPQIIRDSSGNPVAVEPVRPLVVGISAVAGLMVSLPLAAGAAGILEFLAAREFLKRTGSGKSRRRRSRRDG